MVFAHPPELELRMDLYVPKVSAGQRPPPVVIWIFGGSWKIGNKGYHVNLRDLTRHGIAVAAIEYRLSGEAIYPAQIEDCQAAVRWLETHGQRYGIDPRRIGASGESAGGHLAALLGTMEGRKRIRAVCALYPPTDLVSLGEQYADSEKPSAMELLIGGRIEDRRAAATAASPVNHVGSNSPPFLLIHGQEDHLVPIAQSEQLDTALRRAKVESRLISLPGKKHWFLLNDRQVAEVAEFFWRHF